MLSKKSKYILSFVVLLFFIGCATSEIPDYIRSSHPVTRKLSGNYERIVDAVKVVLFEEDVEIQSEINPSIYERRLGGEDESRDILFVTKPKRHSKLIYSTYSHLNIFVRAFADGAEVEIRYESVLPVGRGMRNDKFAKSLLGKIEHELESK